eukprot:946109-Rhodomonas_salina.3
MTTMMMMMTRKERRRQRKQRLGVAKRGCAVEGAVLLLMERCWCRNMLVRRVRRCWSAVCGAACCVGAQQCAERTCCAVLTECMERQEKSKEEIEFEKARAYAPTAPIRAVPY